MDSRDYTGVMFYSTGLEFSRIRSHIPKLRPILIASNHSEMSSNANNWGLTAPELRKLRSLKTPHGIQRVLNDMPYHLADTAWSPRRVLRENTSHCYEGALFAAAALRVIGYPPLLLDLEAEHDTDHVIAVYRVDGHWGALAKSNYTGCRYREPVYRTLRELALSYFEVYFNDHREARVVRSRISLDDLSHAVDLARPGEAPASARRTILSRRLPGTRGKVMLHAPEPHHTFRCTTSMHFCRVLSLVFLFASAFAQNAPSVAISAPPTPIDLKPDASGTVPQAQIRDLLHRVAEHDLENEKRLRDYTYVQREEEHKLDSHGTVKKIESSTSEVLVIYGEQVERLIAKNDKPLSENETKKEEDRIQKITDKRKNESDSARRKTQVARSEGAAEAERSYLDR